MNDGDGMNLQAMTTSGPFDVVPPSYPYLAFMYSGKPRVGLAVCDDDRPGTDNLVVITLDGIRTFKKSNMVSVRNVTTIEVSR